MPQLACPPVSADDGSVQHECAGYAGANGDEDCVTCASRCAKSGLGKQACSDVVSDNSRKAGPRGYEVADRQVTPSQVDREPPNSSSLVDQAGNHNAATRQPNGTIFSRCCRQQSGDDVRDGCPDVSTDVVGGGRGQLGKHVQGPGHECRFHPGTADVDRGHHVPRTRHC